MKENAMKGELLMTEMNSGVMIRKKCLNIIIRNMGKVIKKRKEEKDEMKQSGQSDCT